MSERNLAAARSVLVDGLSPAVVAREYGISKQHLHGILSRVRRRLDDVPLDWVQVDVWLPPEVAAQVRELEAQARAGLEARKGRN